MYFHLRRAALPDAAPGEQLTVRLLVWGPPMLGPLMFALIGLWGISAAWVEDPPDSGRLRLWGRVGLQLPLSKTRAYFLMMGCGAMVTTISAVLDHARTGFENDYLWIPTVVGVFATLVMITLGALERPTRADLTIYALAMGLLMLTGLVGAVLHVQDDLTARGAIVTERFIRGAPFLAPMLFANMGMLGLSVLMDPRSETLKERGILLASPQTRRWRGVGPGDALPPAEKGSLMSSTAPAEPRCLVCQKTSASVPLLTLLYQGASVWICPQHLPILIHDPHKLAGILPGAETLSKADHDDHGR